MRILVLNWLDRGNPHAGGAEVHLHEVFGRLAARGHDIVLVSSGYRGLEPRATLDGIEVHRTGDRHTYGLRVPGYVRRRWGGHPPFDVVVEDLNKVPVFSPFWAPAPVLLLVHHLFGATAFREASPPVAALTWLLERPLARAYRGVPTVAVSESTATDLVARGFERGRVRVVPNGVDTGALTPPASEDERFTVPTLLYLGRLRRYKRVDLAIRALARLREGGTPARLVVAGSGPHRDALEREARRLGVADAVEFRGWVEEEEKTELLRRSWVHVLTSPKEGWGIANLEAAACGTPTVASDSPGLRDSVVDGETGFLVPHGDVALLAGSAGRLLEDGALRSRMADAARRFAEGYTWDAAADAFEEALRLAAARSSG